MSFIFIRPSSELIDIGFCSNLISDFDFLCIMIVKFSNLYFLFSTIVISELFFYCNF